jgi:hypothetical protein
MTSLGTAVDVDEAGNIIVAGNFIVGRQAAELRRAAQPGGSRLWEKDGQVGDEVTGVAAATAQFKNRVFVVGAQRTSDNPVRTDGAVWVYIADGESVFIQPPVTSKRRSRPTSSISTSKLAQRVGPRPRDPAEHRQRLGGRRAGVQGSPDASTTSTAGPSRSASIRSAGWWGRPGPPGRASLRHDAARRSQSAGTSSWPGDGPATSPDAKPQPMIFWLAGRRNCDEHRPELPLASTQINGIACDREGKIVSAGTASEGPPTRRSSPSRTLRPALGTRTGVRATTVPAPWPVTGGASAGGVATARPTRSRTRGAGSSPVAGASPAARSRRRGRRGRSRVLLEEGP